MMTSLLMDADASYAVRNSEYVTPPATNIMILPTADRCAVTSDLFLSAVAQEGFVLYGH